MNNPRHNRFVDLAVEGVRALRPYQPGKPIEELERELGIGEIAKLASNENPLGPSPRALEAIAAAAPGVWLYPDGSGFSLKQRLAARHGVEPEAITLGNGSSDLLEFVVRVFAGPGDEVLYSRHAFAIYPLVAQAAGATPVEVATRGWGHDLDAMAARVGERTKVVFIANPNNPTGTWLDGAALKGFLERLPERVIVVVDEAYFEYASHLEPAYPDASRYLADHPNLLVTRTFSKAFGLAGLRIGYGLSHPDLADLLNRIRPPFNVNSPALAAAEAALADEEHLRRSVALNAEGLRQLGEGFDRLGLEWIASLGNFISVDVGRLGVSLYEALLHEGVIVRPVANYAMPTHLRVSVGLPEQNARLLRALEKVLGKS